MWALTIAGYFRSSPSRSPSLKMSDWSNSDGPITVAKVGLSPGVRLREVATMYRAGWSRSMDGRSRFIAAFRAGNVEPK